MNGFEDALPETRPLPPRYAGLWLRLGATLIDLVILAVPLSVFVSLLSVAMGLSKAFLDLQPGVPPSELLLKFGPTFLYITFVFFALMSWLYFALSESSSRRATLGKRLMSIYVTDLGGGRISFLRATVRFLTGRFLIHTPIAGAYYCLLDLACIAFTRRKQSIHDAVSQSLVLRVTGYSL